MVGTINIGGAGNTTSDSNFGSAGGQSSRNWGGDVWSSNDYPSGRDHGGGGHGGSSSSGNVSHSLQDQHIIKAYQSVGQVLGGAYHDNRKSKDKSDGLSYQAKGILIHLNHYGYKGEKGLVLSDCDLTVSDMKYLSSTIHSLTYNFTLVDFSNNPQIGSAGLDYLIKGQEGVEQVNAVQRHEQGHVPMFLGKPLVMPPEMIAHYKQMYQGTNPDDYIFKGLLTRPNFHMVKLDLSNCNIGDVGAEYIAESLKSGRLPSTRKIDLSGNKITDAGESILVKAMKNPAVQDMIVLTQKLNGNSKLIVGTKEEKISEIKKFIQLGKEKGTFDEAAVVDKSWLGKIKNVGNAVYASSIGVAGFIKCKYAPEDVATGYAQDKMVAKLPKLYNGMAKYATKLLSAQDIVTCYLGATEDTWTSEAGQSFAKHQLCVMGETEFCE